MTGSLLVVGGGPAGAMAAAAAAARGRSTVLIERSAGPHHKVCGEFLSWEARRFLAQAGAALPEGAPIDRLRLHAGGRTRTARLPGTAMGISRCRLDEALLAHAAACGAEIRRGVAASAWQDGAVRLRGGGMLSADRIVLATGKTDLRGTPRRPAPSVTDGLTGFKMHLSLAPEDAAALRRTIELHVFPGGYAGLQPIEGARHNLCLLIATHLVDGWPAVLAHLGRHAPILGERLGRADPLYERPLAIARVPYGFRRRDDRLAVGDQNAVIHSFTGDGLALAIGSGALAGAWGSGDTELAAALRRFAAGPVGRAACLYRGLAARPALLAKAALLPGALRLSARLTRAKMPHIASFQRDKSELGPPQNHLRCVS
ncbi:NAD(P)/FAD-dependent oxidoreductase [Pacificimonas flava]|uniref:Monooxygenase n=1 Tax=Pacificimonas flava TaxID=1234595 RepID=M2TBK6_9SPHN|nr:FAD-dependent monooxygenase [Pacificimonas flava]EMD84004.1 monooxygenase [Pacificimonas flava]MBB5281023.1 flavin-dependent dehydrogenase [Pacificimonas flava]